MLAINLPIIFQELDHTTIEDDIYKIMLSCVSASLKYTQAAGSTRVPVEKSVRTFSLDELKFIAKNSHILLKEDVSNRPKARQGYFDLAMAMRNIVRHFHKLGSKSREASTATIQSNDVVKAIPPVYYAILVLKTLVAGVHCTAIISDQTEVNMMMEICRFVSGYAMNKKAAYTVEIKIIESFLSALWGYLAELTPVDLTNVLRYFRKEALPCAVLSITMWWWYCEALHPVLRYLISGLADSLVAPQLCARMLLGVATSQLDPVTIEIRVPTSFMVLEDAEQRWQSLQIDALSAFRRVTLSLFTPQQQPQKNAAPQKIDHEQQQPYRITFSRWICQSQLQEEAIQLMRKDATEQLNNPENSFQFTPLHVILFSSLGLLRTVENIVSANVRSAIDDTLLLNTGRCTFQKLKLNLPERLGTDAASDLVNDFWHTVYVWALASALDPVSAVTQQENLMLSNKKSGTISPLLQTLDINQIKTLIRSFFACGLCGHGIRRLVSDIGRSGFLARAQQMLPFLRLILVRSNRFVISAAATYPEDIGPILDLELHQISLELSRVFEHLTHVIITQDARRMSATHVLKSLSLTTRKFAQRIFFCWLQMYDVVLSIRAPRQQFYTTPSTLQEKCSIESLSSMYSLYCIFGSMESPLPDKHIQQVFKAVAQVAGRSIVMRSKSSSLNLKPLLRVMAKSADVLDSFLESAGHHHSIPMHQLSWCVHRMFISALALSFNKNVAENVPERVLEELWAPATARLMTHPMATPNLVVACHNAFVTPLMVSPLRPFVARLLPLYVNACSAVKMARLGPHAVITPVLAKSFQRTLARVVRTIEVIENVPGPLGFSKRSISSASDDKARASDIPYFSGATLACMAAHQCFKTAKSFLVLQVGDSRYEMRRAYVFALLSLLHCSDSRVLKRVCALISELLLSVQQPSERSIFFQFAVNAVRSTPCHGVQQQLTEWLLQLEQTINEQPKRRGLHDSHGNQIILLKSKL